MSESDQTVPAELPEGITVDFVRQCREHNERGDGILYAAIMAGRSIYNKTSGRWLVFNGHHWEDDIYDQAANAVEDVASCYQSCADLLVPEIKAAAEALRLANARVAKFNRDAKAKGLTAEEATEIDRSGKEAEAEADVAKIHHSFLLRERKSYLDRVDRLRGKVGVEKTLWFSHTVTGGLRLRSEDLDRHPLLLACSNGVIDLETGDLLQGTPEQYLLRAVPVDFAGMESDASAWRTFLSDIYNDDQEIVDFVRRLLGYCLSGSRREHFIAIFIGDGRNGKGTLFEIMHELLGPLAWAIDPEMIMESKTPPNAASHSAHLASLRGRRLAIGAETDRNRQISGAAVKRLTGGDIIKARSPNDREETNFLPTHKLVLHTNDIPEGLTRDFALRERLVVIPHSNLYVDAEQIARKQADDPHNAGRYRVKDKVLADKLRQTLPAILGDLVAAGIDAHINGLRPPERLLQVVRDLHSEADHLGRFLSSYVQPMDHPECWCEFRIFYATFEKWYSDNVNDNKRYLPSKKSVGKELRNRGYKLPDPRETAGKQKILGVQVLPYE